MSVACATQSITKSTWSKGIRLLPIIGRSSRLPAASGTAPWKRSAAHKPVGKTWTTRYSRTLALSCTLFHFDTLDILSFCSCVVHLLFREDMKMEFKFHHVFEQIENCEKWRDTRMSLSKSKD